MKYEIWNMKIKSFTNMHVCHIWKCMENIEEYTLSYLKKKNINESVHFTFYQVQ